MKLKVTISRTVSQYKDLIIDVTDEELEAIQRDEDTIFLLKEVREAVWEESDSDGYEVQECKPLSRMEEVKLEHERLRNIAQDWFSNLSTDNLPTLEEVQRYENFISTQQVVEKLTNGRTFDWAIPLSFQRYCIDTYGIDPASWETKVVWVYPEAMPFPVTRKAKEFLDTLPI